MQRPTHRPNNALSCNQTGCKTGQSTDEITEGDSHAQTATQYRHRPLGGFLMAIAAEGVFFSLFNPDELAMVSGHEWEAMGAYTVGFFCFWGVLPCAACWPCG
jgi:hypothetical protein